MKTIDGYIVTIEHLEVIIKTCGNEFNITSIQKLKDAYSVEGTYNNVSDLFEKQIELSFIIREVRNKKLDNLGI